MEPDDYRPFDIERGYDVMRVGANRWELRDREGNVTELSDEEFEQLRSAGPNPRGLE